MKYFFALEKFVELGDKEDSEKIASAFKKHLSSHYDDEKFCKLLSCAGFIPDFYPNDSSEETLFSKLTKVLVAEWADRMGFESNIVKTKSGYEDINFSIGEKTVVCDAKSFRLGRSQQAPNVKDFLKPPDSEFSRYFFKLKKIQTKCIESHIERLQKIKAQITEEIENAYEKFSKEELLNELVEYRIKNETRKIDEFIDRIHKFRLGNIEDEN